MNKILLSLSILIFFIDYSVAQTETIFSNKEIGDLIVSLEASNLEGNGEAVYSDKIKTRGSLEYIFNSINVQISPKFNLIDSNKYLLTLQFKGEIKELSSNDLILLYQIIAKELQCKTITTSDSVQSLVLSVDHLLEAPNSLKLETGVLDKIEKQGHLWKAYNIGTKQLTDFLSDYYSIPIKNESDINTGIYVLIDMRNSLEENIEELKSKYGIQLDYSKIEVITYSATNCKL